MAGTAARRGRLVAMAAVLLAAWLATDALPWPARAFAVVVLVVMPVLGVAQASMIETVPSALPRLPVYLSSSLALWVLAGLALAAALASGFTLADLGLVAVPIGVGLAWAAIGTVAALLLAVIGHVAGIRESPVVVQLLPRTGVERLAFIGLSASAGIGEELVYRGFLIPALVVSTGSSAVAVVVSSVVFGLLHAYQGVAGVIRAAVLGAMLAVPLLVTGSVIPSMVAHFVYDVLAGLWLGPWILRR